MIQRLIFAGQQDDVIGKVEADFLHWEIGVADSFSEYDLAVAVLTGESSGLVGVDLEFPELEQFGGDAVIHLGESDFIE